MAEQEDLTKNPLYNRELLKTLMGRSPFETEPSAAPEVKGEISVEPTTPSAPIPPRRPVELKPATAAMSPDEAQAKEAYEQMTAPRFPESLPIIGGEKIPPQALAAASGYGETLAPGVFPRVVGGLAKGAGALGIPGYEKFAEKPYGEVTEEAKKIGAEARAKAPISGAVGTAAGLGAGMATLPVIAAARGPAVSGALTGGLYGAIAQGADEGTISGALKGMLLGAGLGGTLAPVAEHLASGLTRIAFGGRPVVDDAGNLTEEAINIARSAGLSPEQISVLAPQLRQTFEQRGLTKEAAREAPFREFGIEPKRGMVGDDVEQLTHEIKHGEYGPIAEQAGRAAEEFAFQGRPSMTVRDAVDAAVARGEANAKSLKAQYEAAYKTAEQAPGKFSREAITNVGDRLLQNLAIDVNAQHLYHDPLVQQAASQLNKSLGQSIEGPGGIKLLWQNFPAVEGGRKSLNAALSKAQSPTEKAGIRRLIDEYDQYVESKLLDGSFSGSTNVVNDWRKARKLFSEYQTKYGVKKTGEDAGKIMKEIIEQNRDPDSIARMMFNFAGSGDVTAKASALKVYNQLRRALGPNSPELENIKNSFMQQMMTPVLREGEKATPAHFADTSKQIDNFLRGNTAAFAKAVLSDSERATLARFSDVMRMAAKKPSELTPERLGAFSQAMWFSAPAVAEMATGLLSRVLPDNLKAPLLLAAGAYSRRKAMEGSQLAAEAASNLPPRNLPRTYTYPEFRPLIPLGEAAREREGHATGGRTGKIFTAQQMLSRAKSARKAISDQTKTILEQPDESVASALKIASNHI